MELGGLLPPGQVWGAAVGMPGKRRRSDVSGINGGFDGENGATYPSFPTQTLRTPITPSTPSSRHSGFVMIDGQRGVYYSESWEPSGSTLYLPVVGTVLANMTKYDQISFEQGCFCIGDENGRFQHKAQGQAMNCWRYSEQDRKLFISLSYFFTNAQVFQEMLSSLESL
ncbi:hypothetical protein AMEX_G13318 [Astyanax mexicanus]|uniref:Uncharacterized protein n=1 Tax=Astyanax mexicanus TaxID=7994 RepID=A0A8T2LJQ3_ASTMX|nr:hypothetical protein AMEX_G13318 [Astyanax mexicanus]